MRKPQGWKRRGRRRSGLREGEVGRPEGPCAAECSQIPRGDIRSLSPRRTLGTPPQPGIHRKNPHPQILPHRRKPRPLGSHPSKGPQPFPHRREPPSFPTLSPCVEPLSPVPNGGNRIPSPSPIREITGPPAGAACASPARAANQGSGRDTAAGSSACPRAEGRRGRGRTARGWRAEAAAAAAGAASTRPKPWPGRARGARGRRLLAGVEDAAAAAAGGTRSLTSPERGSLGMGGGGAALRHRGDAGGAGQVDNGAAVCPIAVVP